MIRPGTDRLLAGSVDVRDLTSKGDAMQHLLERLINARLVLLVAGVVLLIGSSGASGAATDPLEQECAEVALQKPQVFNIGVLSAGHYARKDQAVFLHARYVAMPEGCRENYLRANSGKAEVFRNGRWARINDWLGLSGGVVRPGPGTSSYIDNQIAFTGLFYSLPFSHLQPKRFDPCRVRILLKEELRHPEHHADSGYHPPLPALAEKMFKIEIPVAKIHPHQGKSCSLLVPDR